MIDEVDKSGDIPFFPTSPGMLRNKYLQRNEGQDFTFQPVVLAGVHDIKTLKAKIRGEGEKGYGSPWNIAVDFKVESIPRSAWGISTESSSKSEKGNCRIHNRIFEQRIYGHMMSKFTRRNRDRMKDI